MKRTFVVGDSYYYPATGVCRIVTADSEQIGGRTNWHLELIGTRKHQVYRPEVQPISKLIPIGEFANRKLLRMQKSIMALKTPRDAGTDDWYWLKHKLVYTSILMNDLLEVLRDLNCLAVSERLDPRWLDLYIVAYNRVVDTYSVVRQRSVSETETRLNSLLAADLIRPSLVLQQSSRAA